MVSPRETRMEPMTETLDAPLSPPDPVREGARGGEARNPAPLAATLHAVLGKIEQAAAEPDPVEMVHEARKALKEYRSLLRLLASAGARAARRHAADVARSFAQARDRATAQEALDLLDQAGLVLACDLQMARDAIGAAPEAEATVAPLRESLRTFLADARARLADGLDEEAATADLVAGLRRGYRAARRGRFGSALAMHETRKSVVAHRYQMSFAAASFAGLGATRSGRAQRLRDVLGAHHDVEILRAMLSDPAHTLEPGASKRLGFAMARLQKRLKRQAMRLHQALFHASSRRFAHKWRARLKHRPVPPTGGVMPRDDD